VQRREEIEIWAVRFRSRFCDGFNVGRQDSWHRETVLIITTTASLPLQTGPGAHQASCTMGTGSFPGGKVRPGRAADHSPPYSAAVMEE